MENITESAAVQWVHLGLIQVSRAMFPDPYTITIQCSKARKHRFAAKLHTNLPVQHCSTDFQHFGDVLSKRFVGQSCKRHPAAESPDMGMGCTQSGVSWHLGTRPWKRQSSALLKLLGRGENDPESWH